MQLHNITTVGKSNYLILCVLFQLGFIITEKDRWVSLSPTETAHTVKFFEGQKACMYVACVFLFMHDICTNIYMHTRTYKYMHI